MRLLISSGITYRIVLHHTRAQQFVHPVGTCTQFRRICPIRVRVATAVHHHIITQIGILACVQQRRNVRGILESTISRYRQFAFPFRSALSGNHHYPIGSTRTVNGCSWCVFQYVQAFHIRHVQWRQTQVGRHTVNHHQRIAVVNGTQTTNLDRYIVTGLSGIHYLHTGDAALNGLSQIRNGSIFDVLASQGGNSTGEVTFLHGSITDNHHFVQHLTVFRECYHNLLLSFHGNFQRLIAYEWNYYNGIRRHIQREIAINTRYRTVRCVLLHHTGPDNGFSGLVFHYTLYCDLLCEHAHRK